MCFYDLLKELLQALMNRPDEHAMPSLRAPDDRGDHQVDTMHFMLLLRVDRLSSIYGYNQPPLQLIQKERRFIPYMNDPDFSRGSSVRNIVQMWRVCTAIFLFFLALLDGALPLTSWNC